MNNTINPEYLKTISKKERRKLIKKIFKCSKDLNDKIIRERVLEQIKIEKFEERLVELSVASIINAIFNLKDTASIELHKTTKEENKNYLIDNDIIDETYINKYTLNKKRIIKQIRKSNLFNKINLKIVDYETYHYCNPNLLIISIHFKVEAA